MYVCVCCDSPSAQIYIMEDGTRILNHTSIPLPDFGPDSSSDVVQMQGR